MGDYLDDPELGDEDDPEYREQLFETFQASGQEPEDVRTDDQFRADYAEFLKKNQ